ncbi:putative endopolygalacturonase D [Aspergillus pseudonomiae]|uniref:endo-polygalacturonase n=1 Tax=Aspergillus pseudonomiae TaxID=1506151 RepID=A0A5N6HJ56_9EURO|nr:putative endopolygalacturonase D [Aspergillus pseudonomiae]KAB8254345.1 putative endopolygalacturonase D [Aspergillus pseudonomiae]KAE8404042.1 putative endopolygalacturonase D [Aspergillus pseudonomiae]
MKRSALILSFIPLAFGCDNPSSPGHSCASIYSVSAAAASSFCATFTASTVTATTGVPAAFLSNCDYKTKHLSSACSCLGTAAAPTAGAPSSVTSVYVTSATVTPTPSAFKTSTAQIVEEAKAVTSSTAVVTNPVSLPTASSSFTGNGGTTCTVTEYAAISSAVVSCSNILLSDIYAPPSSTIDLQGLQTGAAVIFAGKTTFGDTADSDFDPIVVSGTSVTITGAEGHVIDGNGEAYWDGEGSNGGSDKPDHFFVVKDMYNSRIENLYIQNWPVHCFEIESTEHLTISGLTLNNSAGDAANSKSDGDPAAHNSDGFDIKESSYFTLENTWVHNQDDCVAVTSGTDIVVDGMYCYGGHGLSIGSIGGKSDNTVNGVTFSNSQVLSSQNGCRIKTNSGETGEVYNIRYENITLSDISDYGIDVQQDYLNGGPTGEPTNGVTIANVTFVDVTGTMSDGQDYYILCGDDSCSNFVFDGVDITGGSGDSCNYPSSGCP